MAAIRKEGFPGYGIHPEGQRDPYTAIVYLEPFTDRNLRAFGYDMYSEPVRRRAMEEARDSGLMAISSKVRLVQESGGRSRRGSCCTCRSTATVCRTGRWRSGAQHPRLGLLAVPHE